MNLELAIVWGISPEVDEDDWQEEYQHQLFLARRELRNLYQVPKLFDKKWEVYLSWAFKEKSDWKLISRLPGNLNGLDSFERELMRSLNDMEQATNFCELVQRSHELRVLMEGYKNYMIAFTSSWEEEWKNVEVNSREFFPTGPFVYSMKNGGQKEDWKMALLKERKRISFVY